MKATSSWRATDPKVQTRGLATQWPGADTMTLNIAVTVRILICQRWFNGGSLGIATVSWCMLVHVGNPNQCFDGLFLSLLYWNLCFQVSQSSLYLLEKKRPHNDLPTYKIMYIVFSRRSEWSQSCLFQVCEFYLFARLGTFLWSKYTQAFVRKMRKHVKVFALKVDEMMTSSNLSRKWRILR